jgi:hypothetical protein
MTDPAETGSADREEQIREYIHRALFATDMESPAELVRAREVILGRALPKTFIQSRDSDEYLQRREANQARIEECRTRFWDLTHEQLQAMLDLDSLHQDADLQFSAERLIHVSTLRSERDAPGVLIEILLPLQTMPSDRHPMIGGIDDIRVVQLSHRLEFLQHTTDLDIDVLATCELTTNFVSNGPFVTPFPNTTHGNFVAQARVTVWERMRR